MYFQILEIVLWPKNGKPPRTLKLQRHSVNVISGGSKTGKSAVVPIIDYCLGSGKCAIPVGVIREACSWFGIVVETVEGQKLLARREPGDQQRTGDMFVIEGSTVVVPEVIAEKNENVEDVKQMLNRLAGLTGLGIEPDGDSGFKSRPSFRDLVAFTFQPQNIIANPDVLFFKADTTEHREKLKTIFPYVLGAVTAAILQARYELDRATRTLRRKEQELRNLTAATTAWRVEAEAWILQAKEYGLLAPETPTPADWDALVDTLRQILDVDAHAAAPTLAGMDATLARLEELRRVESDTAAELTVHRERLNDLRQLLESSAAYGDAIRVQRDRLGLSDWLRGIVTAEPDPLAEQFGGQQQIEDLCIALQTVELSLRSQPSYSDFLDKEILRQRSAAENALGTLNETRRELAALERQSSEVNAAILRSDQIKRYLGRLEQALKVYDQTDQSSELRQEIAELRSTIDDLQKIVSEAVIQRRTRNALSQIESTAGRFIPQMDSEWPLAPDSNSH